MSKEPNDEFRNYFQMLENELIDLKEFLTKARSEIFDDGEISSETVGKMLAACDQSIKISKKCVKFMFPHRRMD